MFRAESVIPARFARLGLQEGVLASQDVHGTAARQPVAPPERPADVRGELRRATRLGVTSDGMEIVLFDACGDSAVMRELGRLREWTFRNAGEGTGMRRDIDVFDGWYRHIVLWDDSALQIAGAYRVGEAAAIIDRHGISGLYTSTLFEHGDAMRALLPQSLELGRSFVQPRYQGLRALDYLWQGIGAYLATRPGIRYLFGPVSISAALPADARGMLVSFYRRHFGCAETLSTPREPFAMPEEAQASLATVFPGIDYATEFRELKRSLAALGAAVPPLYKQYTELCEPGGTRFLAFGVDPAFAGCIDGLVLVDLDRVKTAKRSRYLRGPTTSNQPFSRDDRQSA